MVKKCLHDSSSSFVRSSPGSSLRDSFAPLADSAPTSANRPALKPRRGGIARVNT